MSSRWLVRAFNRGVALGALVLVALAVLPAAGCWVSVDEARAAASPNFYSGFEPGDPQPTWVDAPETGPHGGPMISGVTGSSDGIGAYPSDGQVSNEFDGPNGFELSGTQVGAGRTYASYKVFSVHIPVTSATELKYYIFPVNVPWLSAPGGAETFPSSYASIDLHFTDGTYLSHLGAEDQYSVKMDPADMGTSATLYPGMWNQVVSRIGAVAAGKTVDRIIVAYDNPNGPGAFSPPQPFDDWFDDIGITGAPAASELDPVQYSNGPPTSYVLTTRGWDSPGDKTRGAAVPFASTVPFGFNFWAPQFSGSGYYQDQWQGFIESHELSYHYGSGFNSFSLMPSPGPIGQAVSSVPYSHADEVAQGQYYGVTLSDGMKAEVTPTDHAAMFRFTFPSDQATVSFGGFNLTVVNAADGFVSGETGTSLGNLFVYGQFDAPITASSGGAVQFDTSADSVVTLRIATSFISLAQAAHNLALEIPPGDTFASVENAAAALWSKILDTVTVQGANNDQKETLYSNIYRAYMYPNQLSENAGSAKHPDWVYWSPFTSGVHQGQVFYNTLFYASYNSQFPLYTLLTPTEDGRVLNGFVQQYKDGGWVGSLTMPGYSGDQIGTEQDALFGDAYLKGVTNFDVQAAYDAGLKDETVPNGPGGLSASLLSDWMFRGYVAADDAAYSVDAPIQVGISDFGLANFARALYERSAPSDPRREEYLAEYEYFLSLSLNYPNQYDPAVGFFQAKTASGQWVYTPQQFDPRNEGPPYLETDAYEESINTAWDGQGLANLFGGRAQLATKLDQLFDTPRTQTGSAEGGEQIEDEALQFGQWGMSDQPGMQLPYFYDDAGEPYKLQAIMRAAMQRLYVGGEIGEGFPGDEDFGSLSSWQPWGDMGLYPLMVGSPYYVIGSPVFKEMTIRPDNGKKIVINAPNNSSTNVYVQSLTLNGKPYNKTYISQSQLDQGAVLDFNMGPRPSKWGTAPQDAPPSVTVGNARPVPVHELSGTWNASQGSDTGALFDKDVTTQDTFDSETPWIEDKLAGARQRVTFYTLTSGAATGGDPSSWVLFGSNDGRHWTTIDTQAAQTFPWREQTRPFKVAHPGTYLYYRLQVTGTTGGLPTTLSEVGFLAGGITSLDGEGRGPSSVEGTAATAASPLTARFARTSRDASKARKRSAKRTR
jgi:predicted alpha-1,2-mannosidase